MADAENTLMRWDAYPEVVSPAGRPIEEQLEVRARRMPMDGYEAVYSDLPDYIIRCTHRIWDEKGVGLCRTHYSEDCRVWMTSGISVGAEDVVRNTLTSMAWYPDRSPTGEDVIWSEDAPGELLSSHRLVSVATNLGDDPAIGPATGNRAHIMVVADCLCKENFIIDEYIVRDNAQFARQNGVTPRQMAMRQAELDREGDQARHNWRREMIAEVHSAERRMPPLDHPASAVAQALRAAFENEMYDEALSATSSSIESYWPSGRRGVGRGFWAGCLFQLRSALANCEFRVGHWAARPLPGGDIAVALRWWLTGTHSLAGIWGQPTAREILVLAISHYRLRNGRIIEDITVYDEVAALRQIEGGVGA